MEDFWPGFVIGAMIAALITIVVCFNGFTVEPGDVAEASAVCAANGGIQEFNHQGRIWCMNGAIFNHKGSTR